MKKKIILPKNIIKRNLPINYVVKDAKLFESSLIYNNIERKIIFLKDVFFIKNVIFSLRNLKFYDKYCFVLKRPLYKLILNLKYLFLKSEKFENAIWITDDWSSEYFHWLTDALTRYIWCYENEIKYLVILPKKFKNIKYIEESLNYLNIDYKILNSKKASISNLVLPSHTANTGNYNTNLINKLNDKFVNNYSKGFKKIYASRQKAKKRKIVNEDKLVEILINHNFEIHFFEDYSFEKQVQLLNQTQQLIGLHGAGLTNMLFMPKGGKIVELRNQSDAHNNCYFSLASDLNHHYYYLECNGNSTDTHNVNVFVDLEKLENILKTLNN